VQFPEFARELTGVRLAEQRGPFRGLAGDGRSGSGWSATACWPWRRRPRPA